MTVNTDPYKDIRPYNDDEIAGAIARLINDDEFIGAIVNYRFSDRTPWVKKLVTPLLKAYLKLKWAKIDSVEGVQLELKKYLEQCIHSTIDELTYSGLENLDENTAYLFVSNHRDITMDPALVNYGLHEVGQKTVRPAIGDNLLKKQSATELMRLNKSFIVKRSAQAPREMLKTLSTLSSYIKHSLDTGHSIWLAQRSGRAKDGNDVTDMAILKMFYFEGKRKKIPFNEYMKSLKIVPVSISYENDPCDQDKANELYQRSETGNYQKSELEDIDSIVKGIVGYKGRVHVAFGQVIGDDFDSPEALAGEINKQIWLNYKFFPFNEFAANSGAELSDDSFREAWLNKLSKLPEPIRPYLIQGYANPVLNSQRCFTDNKSLKALNALDRSKALDKEHS